MQLKDIMTRDVEVISPRYSVVEAAKIMKELNVGALPVGDQKNVVGMITDRDIAIQVVAEGKNPEQCKVEEIMTSPIQIISQDSDVDEASQLMADKKIRRLVVVDQNQKPVGFVALGDIATKSEEREAAQSLEKISQPSHPAH